LSKCCAVARPCCVGLPPTPRSEWRRTCGRRTAINDNVFYFQALLHPGTVFEHRRTWYRSESAPEIAVCILPGSELAFASDVKYQSQWLWPQVIESRVGKFSVLDPQVPQRHDEAIEYLARRNSLH
jgi:hypothetical protein